jgi:murein DD-endopeptidase MepM/ murein hydrolase activator NlpD
MTKKIIKFLLVSFLIGLLWVIIHAGSANSEDHYNSNYPLNLPYDKYTYSFKLTSGYWDKRGNSYHKAWDVSLPAGTPLLAVMDGVAVTRSDDRTGLYVKIKNGPFEVGVAHLSEPLVLTGHHVKRGQVIGYSGSSGESSGPHVHFWITKNGKRQYPQVYMAYSKKSKARYLKNVLNKKKNK